MKSFIMTMLLSACRLLSAFALIQGSVLMSSAPLVLVRQLDAAFELKILIVAPKSARGQVLDMDGFHRMLSINTDMY